MPPGWTCSIPPSPVPLPTFPSTSVPGFHFDPRAPQDHSDCSSNFKAKNSLLCLPFYKVKAQGTNTVTKPFQQHPVKSTCIFDFFQSTHHTKRHLSSFIHISPPSFTLLFISSFIMNHLSHWAYRIHIQHPHSLTHTHRPLHDS